MTSGLLELATNLAALSGEAASAIARGHWKPHLDRIVAVRDIDFDRARALYDCNMPPAAACCDDLDGTSIFLGNSRVGFRSPDSTLMSFWLRSRLLADLAHIERG